MLSKLVHVTRFGTEAGMACYARDAMDDDTGSLEYLLYAVVYEI